MGYKTIIPTLDWGIHIVCLGDWGGSRVKLLSGLRVNTKGACIRSAVLCWLPALVPV